MKYVLTGVAIVAALFVMGVNVATAEEGNEEWWQKIVEAKNPYMGAQPLDDTAYYATSAFYGATP